MAGGIVAALGSCMAPGLGLLADRPASAAAACSNGLARSTDTELEDTRVRLHSGPCCPVDTGLRNNHRRPSGFNAGTVSTYGGAYKGVHW